MPVRSAPVLAETVNEIILAPLPLTLSGLREIHGADVAAFHGQPVPVLKFTAPPPAPFETVTVFVDNA